MPPVFRTIALSTYYRSLHVRCIGRLLQLKSVQNLEIYRTAISRHGVITLYTDQAKALLNTALNFSSHLLFSTIYTDSKINITKARKEALYKYSQVNIKQYIGLITLLTKFNGFSMKAKLNF